VLKALSALNLEKTLCNLILVYSSKLFTAYNPKKSGNEPGGKESVPAR
jgi:hypothetical protein